MKKIDEIPTNTGDPGGKIEKKIKVMQDEDSRKANIIVYNAAKSKGTTLASYRTCARICR